MLLPVTVSLSNGLAIACSMGSIVNGKYVPSESELAAIREIAVIAEMKEKARGIGWFE